ncbi:MAG: hypothetical protein FJ301_09380 [Planctomycetes bacterium]|nr:hypothetical protein [Planctomycetota bacterium]
MPAARRFAVSLASALTVVLAGCGRGSSGDRTPPPEQQRLMVTAGTTVLEPTIASPAVVDVQALHGARIDAYYRLSTPADEPFQFELVTWGSPIGFDFVTVRHLRDGGAATATDGFSLARAGVQPSGQGLAGSGDTIFSTGEGFCRLTLQGRIAEEQSFAVWTDGGGVTVVEVEIGFASEINRVPAVEPEPPSVLSRETIHSSASWQFGLPTVARSGDRTSIVCYEGDRQQPNTLARYEQRLQHDAQTGAVTGGAEALQTADSGFWRDHEVAALFNVLAVARSEAEGVRLRLSFDRGATFAQDVPLLPGFAPARLVQTAMAADYTIAVAAWRQRASADGQEFVVVEGVPMAYDGNGSPTWYVFTPAEVLYTTPLDVTPLTTGIAWSDGGDLVVGYAANWFEAVPGGAWRSTTQFRCATRLWGESWQHAEVDREEMFGMDPTVAVRGQGETLQIFYAYEVRDGLRLATSDDGGFAWTVAAAFGQPGDHLPTVFVRDGAAPGAAKVDVLYLATRAAGTELHRASWAEWGVSERVDEALTRASFVASAFVPQTGMPPGLSLPFVLATTQVGWLGYDAVQVGDELVIAYDEVAMDSVMFGMGLGQSFPNASTTAGGPAYGPIFNPAVPPPLAPGLTEPMPAPDPAHMHQLKLLRVQ